MGECTGSICLAYGLESCQCIAGPSDPDTKACELCCKEPGEDTECKSSFLWNDVPFDVPDMFAKPGTPCNDYNGYVLQEICLRQVHNFCSLYLKNLQTQTNLVSLI